jgi:hypothetical protein
LDYKNLKDKTQNMNVLKKTCSTINSKTALTQNKETELKKKNGKCIYDDDDIILMSDHEEEDSLERLMDEMEKEINNTQLFDEKDTKKCPSTIKIHNTKRCFKTEGKKIYLVN